MILEFEKTFVKDVMKEEVVGSWVKPKGFHLAAVSLHNSALKLNLNLVYGKFPEFKRFISKEFDETIDHKESLAYYIGFDHKGTRWHFVNIQKNDWLAEDYGTLAHELHHFVYGALYEKGVEYGRGGEEVFAYIQGHFMELVVRAFLMLKKRQKIHKFLP